MVTTKTLRLRYACIHYTYVCMAPPFVTSLAVGFLTCVDLQVLLVPGADLVQRLCGIIKSFSVLSSFIALFEAQSFPRRPTRRELTWTACARYGSLVLLYGNSHDHKRGCTRERGISCESDHSEMSPQVALMTTTECGRVKCRDAALPFSCSCCGCSCGACSIVFF